MSERATAWRRQQVERMKQRVRHYYDGWGGSSERVTGLLATTRTPCSCYMCGNPRKHFGTLTRQERRANQEAQEAADE